MPRTKKEVETPDEVKTPNNVNSTGTIEIKMEPETIQIKKDEWQKVQDQLKMLYEVADKGRVFNYENSRSDKPASKVKLSLFGNGIIVGWRTVKDELIKHPTTGLTVGEEQVYELLILDKEGNTTKATLSGYPAFSNARYNDRIEAEVVSKKESLDGTWTFEVMLPDGRKISLDARFVN